MKNPVIQKARKEAYEVGLKKGYELGKNASLEFFILKVQGLDQVPGIGPKAFEKFVNHFGPEYFVKVGEKK